MWQRLRAHARSLLQTVGLEANTSAASGLIAQCNEWRTRVIHYHANMNTASAARASAINYVPLIGCLMMLQPLSTDLYLASLPGIGTRFNASTSAVQLTLSVFMLCFGVMQLFTGPLSDRLGRRPVLLGGLAAYLWGSLVCMFAPTLAVLVTGRGLQAIGCCTAVVIARAIVRDVYAPQEGAKKLAEALAVLSIGPLLGPPLGSWLEVMFSFRGAFAALSLFSALLGAWILWRFAETNRNLNPHATDAGPMLANYAAIARSRPWIANTLLASASYGGLFAFISGSSFVLIKVLAVPVTMFGLAFAACVAGYLIGTLVCRRTLGKAGLQTTLSIGAWVSALSGMAMLLLALAGVVHWLAILVPQFFYMMAHGFNFPCSQNGAVAPFPEKAGAAAGLLGFVVMLTAFLVGTWIGASYNGTTLPLAATMAVAGVSVWLVRFGLLRES